MPVEMIKLLFDIFLIFMFGTIGCLAVTLAVHPFVPKAMLNTYFKEPYFSSTEIQVFTGFPFGYIRTGMFMRLAGFPSSGKKRGLTEAYTLAPRWFRVFSRIVLPLFVINLTAFFLIGTFFFFAL